MTDFSGAAIGERVALYRKLNGQTMDELSNATGGALKRDVIANIESGRRKDVTVSQLLALSTALEVPPSALILDVTSPSSPAGFGPQVVIGRSLSNGAESVDTRPMTVSEALPWLAIYPMRDTGLPAAGVVVRLVDSWRKVRRDIAAIQRAEKRYQEELDQMGPRFSFWRNAYGEAILEAWRSYRDATAKGISGVEMPPVAESIGQDLLSQVSPVELDVDWGQPPDEFFTGIPPERLERENWTYNYSMPQEAFDRFTQLIVDGEPSAKARGDG